MKLVLLTLQFSFNQAIFVKLTHSPCIAFEHNVHCATLSYSHSHIHWAQLEVIMYSELLTHPSQTDFAAFI